MPVNDKASTKKKTFFLFKLETSLSYDFDDTISITSNCFNS